MTSRSSGSRKSRQGTKARAASSSSSRKRTHRRHGPRPPRELREAGISARRSLGQHFLVSAATTRRIAEALEPRHDEAVIEIGPGLGGLTAELSQRDTRVVAIELDDELARYLHERFADTNVTIMQGDATEVDPVEALRRAGAAPPYVVAGNLPYNVAQPILRRYLEATPPPRRLVVMVQAEVADSIVAQPGDMSLLGVSVQLYGEPRKLFRVPPSAFYPPPKVRSAVVRIDVAPRRRAPVRDTEAFFRVARAGFSTKRKQLRNALANGLDIRSVEAAELLERAGIEPARRAQELSLDEWAALADAWRERAAAGDTP